MSETAPRNRPENPATEPAAGTPKTLGAGPGTASVGAATDRPRRGGGDPALRGRTTIADGVVEKIAGMAARDVVGVHAMGGGLARTFGVVRDRVPGGRSVTRGVKAEVGEVQTALDLEIVVDYGVSIADVARAVRENVIAAVERMTGLEVVEVNIAVSDVKLPDEEEESPEPRLQ
ncbi:MULTISPECIES: Asp23/Gls24 family envelope stress response protein [Streptomyces violaceusniger group]|uniref:Asp23/Gls24 family envelope stress response protein n=2 Tax=Streptomyces javensis TaxID=114698 RepID=A0ABN1WV46_9ACTN|nr:Asp23/Gls24 family envelope stress response protein [Streptomyces javensis]MBI0319867.1 Asp23/Gls24 family envelope stress response protein [Streptomyces javensis]